MSMCIGSGLRVVRGRPLLLPIISQELGRGQRRTGIRPGIESGTELCAGGYGGPQPLLRDPPHRLEVELAGTEHRDRVDLDEVLAAGDEQVGQALGAQTLEGVLDLAVVERRQHGELLSLPLVADRRDGEDLRVAPIAWWSASSTRPCGTISPPILEKRERRPEI